MVGLEGLIQWLQEVMANPWMLAFLVVWAWGWMLKEHTTLNNKLIPWFVMAMAAILSFAIIEATMNGVLIGVVIGWVQIGFYEWVKNNIGFFKE
jgi:hypothetical protein